MSDHVTDYVLSDTSWLLTVELQAYTEFKQP